MAINRIDEGIALCKEILQDSEGRSPNLMGLLRKVRRLAQLLDKVNDDDFSRFIKEEIESRTPSDGYHEFISVGRYNLMVADIHFFISEKWIELQFGGIIENIFNNTKKLVDSKLVIICPEALEKFASAYERLKDTNPESWAQAVTTCRRILQDFADAIYPPKEVLVKGRKVGKNEYINRLWAFASEKIKSESNKKLIQNEINYIGGIIESIYKLTCKGTHAEISKDEAERVIIRTYLLIGDLIKLGSFNISKDRQV